MKNQNLIVIGLVVLSLIACGKATNSEPGTSAAGTQAPASAHSGSIGTQGGGGTLVFAFRQGSQIAKEMMESTEQIAIADPTNDRINAFYQRHRARWIRSLENFVLRPQIISETNDALQENGVAVGAKSLPETLPERVVLSVPYLTSREGFPADKAFALAIHEAGHFAVSPLSAEEHLYLDQIANLLYARRRATRSPRPRIEFDSTFNFSWGSPHLSSDGSVLTYFTGSYEIRTLDLDTGLTFTEHGAPRSGGVTGGGDSVVLSGDWVALRENDTRFLIKNQITRQRIRVEVPDVGVGLSLLEDGRTLAIDDGSSVILHGLHSNERRTIRRLGRTHFGSQFDSEYRYQATSGDGVAFFDLQRQEVIDFVRRSANPFGAFFVGGRTAVILWYSGRLEHEILNFGSAENRVTIPASIFLGKNETENALLFARTHRESADPGLIWVDLATRAQRATPIPGLSNIKAFPSQFNSGVVKKQDLSLWLTTFADVGSATRLCRIGDTENLSGVFTTAAGRIVVTVRDSDQKLIVRYLDRR